MASRSNEMDETSYRRIRETLQLLKETDARNRVLFLLVKNLGIEIQSLREETKKLRTVVLTLLADPQAREDAVAVLKDFQLNKNNPK